MTICAHYVPEVLPAPRRGMARILLIGASGQVGWELARSLTVLGDVVCAARTGHARMVDLARPETIREAIRSVAPALIVNAAAYTAVDKAETERDLAMAVNGTAPAVLAEEARRIGSALVHYSTDYVFSGGGDTPWREDDLTGPLNYYGATKLAGEQAIRAADVPHLILRVSWVYGLMGHNFVKTMLRLGRQRAELSIVNDQIGTPTSARAIADVTAQILAQGNRDWSAFFRERGGVVHFACRGFTSWHGFAEQIFEQARQRGDDLVVQKLHGIPTAQYPTPAQRPFNSRMNCDRLRERFGLQGPAWETALAHSLPIYSESPVAQLKVA